MSEEKSREELQEEVEAVEVEVAEAADGAAGGAAAGEAEAVEETVDPEADLAAARQENAELRDRLLRMAAENDNFKKRMERERSQLLKYASESVFREILGVVDNLERATALGSGEGAGTDQQYGALLEGVQLTLKSLQTTLEKFEVKPIDSVGKPFDPTCQEAMVMEASETVPASHVLTEFEKGYYYKDRLLRAAKVVVSSGSPAAEEGA